MRKLDPYEELGVPRDADRAAVRRAYRRRAKETHPDADGGSADAFKRTRTALSVLLDPARRERFDSTGDVEDDKPDNARSAALQVISKHLGDILNAFTASQLQDRARDPRTRDVLAEMRGAIGAEIAKGREAIEVGARMVRFYEDMAARFKEPEKDAFLRRAAEDAARQAQEQRDRLREQVATHEKALELLKDRGFRWDEPPPQAMPMVRAFHVDFATGQMREVAQPDWGDR